MNVKAVLFDIDGTLIDSNGCHIRVWEEAFRKHGFKIDCASIHAQIGKGSDMLVPALVPEANKALVKALDKTQGDIFKERYLSRMQPFAKARELIMRVHEGGQKVVLASSASQAELEHYVDLLSAREIVTANQRRRCSEHQAGA